MVEQSGYFQEGGVAYARWAADDWKASTPKCPYPEDGHAARGWHSGFRYWFYLDYGSPRIWTEAAIERISKQTVRQGRARRAGEGT
jgi:hypothetical protein